MESLIIKLKGILRLYPSLLLDPEKNSLMNFRVELKKKKQLLYSHYFVAVKELVVFFKDPFPFPIQKNT